MYTIGTFPAKNSTLTQIQMAWKAAWPGPTLLDCSDWSMLEALWSLDRMSHCRRTGTRLAHTSNRMESCGKTRLDVQALPFHNRHKKIKKKSFEIRKIWWSYNLHIDNKLESLSISFKWLGGGVFLFFKVFPYFTIWIVRSNNNSNVRGGG